MHSDSDSPPRLPASKSNSSLRLANYAHGRLIMQGLSSSPSSPSVVSPLGSAKSSAKNSARNSPRHRMSPTSIQMKFSVISPRSSGVNSPALRGSLSSVLPPSCPSSNASSPYRFNTFRVSKGVTLSPNLNCGERTSQSLNTSPRNKGRRLGSKQKGNDRRRRSLPLQTQHQPEANFFDIDSLDLPETQKILVHTAPSSPRLRKRAYRSHSGHTTPSIGSPRNSTLALSAGRPLHNTSFRRRQKGRERTALFVDSITLDSKLICVLLGQLGYHTTCVATAEEALYMTQNNLYDVILIEAQKMDAHGCCRKIRNMERVKGQQVTPVFALTSQVNPGALQLGSKAGLSGAIQKGAVLGRMIPKAIKFAQKNADKFLFINSDGSMAEQVGLSRMHEEHREKETDLKLRFRVTPATPKSKSKSKSKPKSKSKSIATATSKNLTITTSGSRLRKTSL